MTMKRILSFLAVMLVAATAFAQENTPQRYGIKSGKFVTETKVMGQTIAATTWFDDFGNVSLTRTTTSMMGQDIDMGTLVKGEKTYMINYSASQMQEMPAQESINFMDLSDAQVEQYKIKTLGMEEVAGKDCIKFSAEISQMGQTAKVTASVWNGIPMKTVTSAMGMDVVAVVTSIEEGPVDAALFELPKF